MKNPIINNFANKSPWARVIAAIFLGILGAFLLCGIKFGEGCSWLYRKTLGW